MKVLKEGHLYELDSMDGTNPQRIQFIEKTKPSNSDELVTVADGTTNEEYIAVLIHRVQTLNAKFPCRENALVITKLQEALMWMEERTRERKARGVEGKYIK